MHSIWVANSGKTKVAVDVITNHKDKIKKVLIVCPNSVVDVWPTQFERHSEEKPMMVALNEVGLGKKVTVERKMEIAKLTLKTAAMQKKTAVIIINYESLWREPFASWALNAEFDMVVLDECVPKGTLIATPTGHQPIESISTGDIVLGHKMNKVIASKVTHTFQRESNDALWSVNGLHLTGNHPVWSGKRYVNAEYLSNSRYVKRIVMEKSSCREDDCELLTRRHDSFTKLAPFDVRGGKGFTIYQQAVVEKPSGKSDLQPLHNLETETGNYFADGILVHNCHRIKASGGKTTKFCEKMGRDVPYRLGLSGTPLPHSPADVYGQYRFLDTGIFGTSFAKFRSEYCNMGGFQGHQVVSYKNLDQLAEKMYSIGFRVMSKDVFDLPKFIDDTREFRLEAGEQAIYRDMETNFCVSLNDEMITADNALVKLLRLQEITSGFLEGQRIGDGKKKLLDDVMEDFNKTEPIVVFARFTNDLQNIKAVAESQGRRYAELSGHANELAGWQRGESDVLGVQIKSGREGVDFTRSRYCIYYSLGYSLGDYNQSRARVDRPGQKREGTYYHLIAKGTIDEVVMKALANREEVVESVLKYYGR